jgi:hypothetical protein
MTPPFAPAAPEWMCEAVTPVNPVVFRATVIVVLAASTVTVAVPVAVDVVGGTSWVALRTAFSVVAIPVGGVTASPPPPNTYASSVSSEVSKTAVRVYNHVVLI